MHTVIETPAYLASAKEVGLAEDERVDIVSMLARSPDTGVLIPGSGGARKVRVAAAGRGKSGGYRVITYFAADDIPVFLLDVYAKGSKADLSKTELNELRSILGGLAAAWREGTRRRAIRTGRTI